MGETERSLKERTEEHLRDVRRQADKPMRHFEGNCEEHIRVAILKRTFQESRLERHLAEEQWILKLKTKVPQGCNIKRRCHEYGSFRWSDCSLTLGRHGYYFPPVCLVESQLRLYSPMFVQRGYGSDRACAWYALVLPWATNEICRQQTPETLIRPLQEQSDMGLHCLHRTACSKI